jgi:uncharacterized membrane protein YozB (DUF420 family)
MNKKYIHDHITLFAIMLFLIVFGFIQALKPRFLYNTDGSIREFGVGYKNKTIFPVWLLSIILGILCYLIVLAYVVYF